MQIKLLFTIKFVVITYINICMSMGLLILLCGDEQFNISVINYVFVFLKSF